jgi:putative flippase GtrA
LIAQLLRFGVVGVIGFCVDAGLLVAVVTLVKVAPIPARIVSFLVAASVTYLLNHRFTFALTGAFSASRWASYLLTTALGACINVGIYRLYVLHMGALPIDLIIGTALGSIAAMFVNYFMSSAVVFRPMKHVPRV